MSTNVLRISKVHEWRHEHRVWNLYYLGSPDETRVRSANRFEDEMLNAARETWGARTDSPTSENKLALEDDLAKTRVIFYKIIQLLIELKYPESNLITLCAEYASMPRD